jgi:hypothetical protein
MTVAAAFIAASVSVARADSCDDQAAMLAGHIDGLKVGAARAGVIALEHPLVARASLGCSGRNITNEVFAAAKTSKPPPEFYDFVANAAALIFAIPKPDVLRGAKRCTGRIGFIHGHNIDTRYRRLDIRCSGSKTEQTISISREKDDDS